MLSTRKRTLLSWWLAIVVLLSISISTTTATAAEKNSPDHKPSVHVVDSTSDDDYDDDPLYEANPDYSDTDDDDSDHEEEEEEKAKTAVNSALKKKEKLPTRVMTFVKKRRLQITLVLTVIAFRREIAKVIQTKILPKDGTKYKMPPLDFTQLLKIVVFIDIMRQLQAAGNKKGDPLLIALLLLGAKNPVMSSILTKTLLQENNSFIPPIEQHYTFERINDRYDKDTQALQKAARYSPKKKKSAKEPISQLYQSLREKQQHATNPQKYAATIIVLDLSNINKAPGRIDMLRDEVSFLIHQHDKKTIPYNTDNDNDDNDEEEEDRQLEVLVLLESPGGAANEFALASQQLLRLRNVENITVTVVVDRIAASGGYMIACAASPGQLYAAPFAVLGSIGVIGQAINVQKLLDGWGIQGMVFKAGKDKAPGGNLIGEVSKRDKRGLQSIVDETHAAFKRYVAEARPTLARTIEDVATGKIWLGYDALEEGLIDRVVTSDEYIRERIMDEDALVLKLIKNTRKRTLFGGGPNQSQQGILDRSIFSIKTEAKKALSYLAERVNLPVSGGEELAAEDDISTLTSTKLPYHQTPKAQDTSF
ncbi:Probable protease SohB [Seminavis robusta]|uniref:Probable protease SohB n=1 Tax=Seminavis robusta TaxID=568900 RepID=A0A9N8DB68_9STRA|nr:Probable protease SohB [Seminavis robusta]|eukprot:Sro72_g040100.1 Probable protease SohB (593) ;mRNA; f:122294-124072